MDDSLSFESFLSGAGKAAYKAMEDHGRGEYDEFALHAGVAVERLAKAALVKKNPLYLVEMRNGNSDMLLYFGGDLEMDGERVRTVGANEALKRLRRMGVLPLDPKLDLLIELRNGTAHTTVGDQAKALLPTLAEAVAILLRDVGISFDQFWGRWSSAVYVAIDKHRGEVQRDVEVRIRQARHLFEDRFKGLPPGAKERALTVPQSRLSEWIETVEIRTGGVPILKTSGGDCPACGSRGILTFEPTHQTATDTHYSANGFACSLCTFEVSGPDEMAALRKANTPAMVTTMSVTHGPTLSPEELKSGETS
ncbi:hypothetical protein QQY66_37520 [Streptomyces sp. DG2A-72]|uniref:hypothetical protein n=1 Tax=Streptomyces sp. DG2A-72 TaxID=3051386 RepID=UPI00265BA30D|nr:hypothetical protein [Streptomyces sp. DG2A-72]MDO0937141.1 hypothetical protein [Streptomyces sp. DG2A-72]